MSDDQNGREDGTDRLSVGQAAAKVGISADALRYYEREDLLRAGRTAQGHRCYSRQDLEWIGVLTCLRDTGMPIRQMREFARLVREDAEETFVDRVELLERHRGEALAHIRALEENLARLDRKIAWYRARIDGAAAGDPGTAAAGDRALTLPSAGSDRTVSTRPRRPS